MYNYENQGENQGETRGEERRCKPVCAGVVLRNEKKEYLLVLGREHRKWSFPKGHIEDGESWQECAQRETFEETGLTVSIPEDVRQDTKRVRKCFTQKSVYFLLKTDCIQGDLELAPRDVEEIIEINWFDRRKLLGMARDDVNSDLWQFITALKWIY
jgi:8-oxo-dGTP pyrophosphatase MutT (NUDIX family)